MIFIALGSNLRGRFSSPDVVLSEAISALDTAGLSVVALSSIWLTAPVPVSDQPFYRNAVVQIETDSSPQDLLKTLKSIEALFGRTEAERNAARILDLDIVAYNDVICTDIDPILPHPRMHERSFVLNPLSEIAPDWQHPVLKKTVHQLLEAIESYQHVQVLPDWPKIKGSHE